MRIYCSGSEMICNPGNAITEIIDDYIASGTELMVSDYNMGDRELQCYISSKDYKKVTVVFTRESSEFESWPRLNMGKWAYRELVRHQYEYGLDLTLTYNMARECDGAFFAWDEIDMEIFVAMLTFLALGKTCIVYSSKNKSISTFNDIEELSKYITKKDIISKKTVRGIIIGDNVNIDILSNYIDLPNEIKKTIVKIGNKLVNKQELKKAISKSRISIQKKKKIVEQLVDEENLYSELIRNVKEWRIRSGDENELCFILMDMVEHSFLTANNNLYIANSWMVHSDGHNDDIVLYLFERFKKEDGDYNDIPIGVYTDIEEALYYLECSPFDAYGGKIEVWEKSRGLMRYMHYKHKITFYSDSRRVYGFEFMRIADPYNESDPFEPVTYRSENSNYTE